MAEMTISAALEEKLRGAESLDEVVQVCAEAGIPVTKEQLECPAVSGPDGELSEDALDNVSGGGVIDWIRRIYRYYRASNYSSGSGRGGLASGGGGGGGGGGSAGGRI